MQGLLLRFRTLFNLPSVMRALIERKDYDSAVHEYLKAKSIALPGHVRGGGGGGGGVRGGEVGEGMVGRDGERRGEWDKKGITISLRFQGACFCRTLR